MTQKIMVKILSPCVRRVRALLPAPSILYILHLWVDREEKKKRERERGTEMEREGGKTSALAAMYRNEKREPMECGAQPLPLASQLLCSSRKA